jgi:hypothetical protein
MAKLVAPMAVIQECVHDEDALAASSPELVAVAIHFIMMQVLAYLPPILFLSTYLVLSPTTGTTRTSNNNHKLGFLAFAYVAGGCLLTHVLIPIPTPEEGVSFMGLKMHPANYLQSTFLILNLAAAMTVDIMLSVYHEALLGVNLLLDCGLMAMLVAPMTVIQECVPEGGALAASSPELVAVAVHCIMVQVLAYLPPILFLSTYLIWSPTATGTTTSNNQAWLFGVCLRVGRFLVEPCTQPLANTRRGLFVPGP